MRVNKDRFTLPKFTAKMSMIIIRISMRIMPCSYALLDSGTLGDYMHIGCVTLPTASKTSTAQILTCKCHLRFCKKNFVKCAWDLKMNI